MSENNKSQNIQEELLKIQLEDARLGLIQKQRAEQEFLQKKNQDDNFRKSRLAAVEQERASKELQQSSCPHTKQNGQPCIGGQKDHRGHYHFLCMWCMKEWIDGELPMHLRIPMERVGGPI